MEKMEVYGTEQSDRVKQKWNREFWTVLFYVSFFFSFLFSVEFPPQRDAVRLMFGKYFPRLSSLFTWLATFPVFHLKECSYRIQKSKQSIYISFLLSIQFCIEKYVFVNFLFFCFFCLNSRCLYVDPELIPSVATCVGHPLCPSIWPQWYEEARCS